MSAAEMGSHEGTAGTVVATAPYAGFWLRAVATLIDWIVLQCSTWLLELVVLGAIYWGKSLSGVQQGSLWDSFNSVTAQIIEALIYLALSVPYYVVAQHRYGTTLGKWPLRIYVVRASDQGRITMKQSAIRWACYLVSYLPFGTGFLMAAFHPEKRALHDLIAGTACVRMPKARQPSGT